MSALVPGTVLASLVAAGRVPDPYFGLVNDELLIDAGDAGGLEAYTFWYRATMRPPPVAHRSGARTFLDLRGINYTADVWVNSINVTAAAPLIGMFMRHRLDVTDLVRPGRRNVLAIGCILPIHQASLPTAKACLSRRERVARSPWDPRVGRNVVNQVSAGWDFWQPVRTTPASGTTWR